MGDVLFLPAQYACDLTPTSKGADYIGPVPIFAESALSRRECVHLLWSGTDSRLTNGAFGDHYSSPSDGSLYPPGRRTIAAKVRSGLAELREASAPMALMACRVFAIAVRSNHQRHDKPPMIAKQVTSSALN